MTVTEFTGGTLPAGWTAQAPAGSSVDLPGDHLQLTIDPNQTFNSLSGTISVPQGPLVFRTVAGAFDLAVGLAEEACNLPNQGLDLLALSSEVANGIRFANFSGAQTGSYQNDIGWFVRNTNPGVNVVSSTGAALMGGLYGGPGWLRLAWDGVDTFTCYGSHTGASGSWNQIASFTSGFVPDRFAIHATATPSGTDGRVQRIQRVVDLLARGNDDATDPPTPAGTTTLFSTDFADGTLPVWLTAQTDNGGAVATDTSGAELRITEAQVGSQAWLLGPGSLPVSHGLLLRYQLAAAGYTNAFWAPAIAVATTTDIAGTRTPDDKFGPGTSLLMEMPARVHAGDGILLRTLRRSPIRTDAVQTGTREFDGYTLLIEDLAAPVGTVGTPLSWLRLERAGHTFRTRVWLDADPEPSTWNYEAQDHMRHGDQIAIALSHNDSVSGVGEAAVLLSHVELYEITFATTAEGTAAAGLGLSFAASGARDSAGTAAFGLGLELAGTGARDSAGAAQFGIGLQLAATGTRPSQGTAAFTLGLTLAATSMEPGDDQLPELTGTVTVRTLAGTVLPEGLSGTAATRQLSGSVG